MNDQAFSVGNRTVRSAILSILFVSNMVAQEPPPTFSKQFLPNTITRGAVSTLTFTIDNSASAIAASGLDFTDNLPAGLVVATPSNASTSCTGGTLTIVSGTSVISYTNGSVNGGSTCAVSVDVIGSASGTHANTSGDLTSSSGNSGTASATLQVIDPPENLFCQTQLPSGAELDSLLARHRRFQETYDPIGPVPLLAGLKIIPVQIHIVNRDDGTGGIAEASVLAEINTLNMIYQGAGLIFVTCASAEIINSTAAFVMDNTGEADLLAAANNVPNVLNMYFVDSAHHEAVGSACGWATYTSSADDYVLMDNDCATNGSTLAHEVGHYFDLFHTHQTGPGVELVDGSNCMTAGDLMCSTPADPNLSGKVDAMTCMYTGMDTDPNGDIYNPDPTNLMSYSTKNCRTNFTAEQLAKVAFTADNARSYVSIISCPPDQNDILDDNCQFVLPDYRDQITYNLSCPVVDTIQNPPPGTILNGVNSTLVTITVVDAMDDFSSCSFMVNTMDTTPPVFANPVEPDSILTDADCQGLVPDYRDSTSITDNCDFAPVLTQQPPPGTNLGGVGTMQTVLLIAQDISGNRDTLPIPVTVIDANPNATLNCMDLNLSVNQFGMAEFILSELVPGANCTELLHIQIETQYGSIILSDGDELQNTLVTIPACDYLGQTLKARITNESGESCWGKITLKQSHGPQFLSGRRTAVFCTDTLVDHGSIFNIPPIAFLPCGDLAEVSFVSDWTTPFPCESDTAKVILREYEAFDKLGRRATVLDTIVVVKLPQITNVILGADFRNISCVQNDTLFCGENELTQSDGKTPVGPYLLVEEFPAIPMADLDGDGVNCDTIFFCYYQDGEFIEGFEGIGKCGLTIHKDVWEFGNRCDKQYKVILEIKQDCAKDPVLLDCSPVGSTNIETIAPGYYRCEFWLTDLDTTAPLLAEKVIGEYECLVIDTNDLIDGNIFNSFVPLVTTSTHDCIAHAEIPPLCVFDDWSGIKAVKATIEGIGTYVMHPTQDTCILFDVEDDPISFGGGIGKEFLDSLLAVLGDSLTEILLQQIRFGTCYRSYTKVPLPKRELPYLVIYEAMDSCHIVGRDSALIKVKDQTSPVVVADKGVSVSLSDKKVWVDAEHFDEGSWDNCGVEFILARRSDWQTACVDLGYNYDDSCQSKESALCWLWTDGHDTLWTVDLENDKHCDEVEAHYANQLEWLCNDGSNCGNLLYNSWQYDLIKFATLKKDPHLDVEAFERRFDRAVGEPKSSDQFKITNDLLLEEIKQLIPDSLFIDSNHVIAGVFTIDVFKCQNLIQDYCIPLFSEVAGVGGIFGDEELLFFLQSGGCLSGFVDSLPDIMIPFFLPADLRARTFDEWSQLGGGWSDAVVFSCEDACGPVTVEILVMDYWCNWAKAWTNVWVEDKTPVQVVKDVIDEETITCKTYKDARYDYPGQTHPVSLDYVVEQAKAGEEDAYDLLDEVFGGYCKAWKDPYGNYVDIEGNEIECDIPFYDSVCQCTSYTDKVRVYDEHHGFIWKDSLITKCDYYQDTIDFQKGIVLVNCEENVYCEQEVWCEFDHCGQGYIFRKFKIWQSCPDSFYLDHNVPDSLKHPVDTIYRHQRIWVGNECPLSKYMFDVPEDTEVNTCGLEYDASGNLIGAAGPESTGYATYRFDDDCRLVGIGHSDKVFKIVGGDAACYKILRTWYFADWCGYGGEPLEAQWWFERELVIDSCVQKIIVIDTMPPVCVITGPVESGGSIEVGACAYNLEVTVSAIDSCGIDRYYWELLDISDSTATVVVDDGSGSLGGSGDESFDISSEDLDHGTYKLKVVTVDNCNNEGYCEYVVDVVSVKKPSPVCVTSLTARLTPWDSDQDGEVDSAHAVVWAGEFDRSSAPACQDTAIEFRIEFIKGDSTDNDAAGDADSLSLGCSDIGTHGVRLWVVSLPSDSRDYCDVVLIVQSDGDGCGTSEVGEREPLREVSGMTEESRAMDRGMLSTDGGKKATGIGGRPLDGRTLLPGQGYGLEQNRPNPFAEETSIGFVLPSSMEATITVYDVTGRIIRSIEGDFQKGYNQVQFRKTDLGVSGILYYRLNAGTYTAARKMILIE